MTDDKKNVIDLKPKVKNDEDARSESQNISDTINESKLVKCPQCGSTLLVQGMVMIKVSAVASSTGEAGVTPVAMPLICAMCSTPIDPSTLEDPTDTDKSGLIIH